MHGDTSACVKSCRTWRIVCLIYRTFALNQTQKKRVVGPHYCQAELYAGRDACCPLVSHGEYADGTDGETYGRHRPLHYAFRYATSVIRNRTKTENRYSWEETIQTIGRGVSPGEEELITWRGLMKQAGLSLWKREAVIDEQSGETTKEDLQESIELHLPTKSVVQTCMHYNFWRVNSRREKRLLFRKFSICHKGWYRGSSIELVCAVSNVLLC